MRSKRIEPGPGQESVWDYPRPPRLERSTRVIEVVLGGETIARSTAAVRVLETSSPPVYYLPPSDIVPGVLHPVEGTTWCEWKGAATYLDASAGDASAERAAWTYLQPTAAFAQITGYIAFYPGRVHACFLDGERVTPQPGAFYGGWITSEIVGPFKGEPGTSGW